MKCRFELTQLLDQLTYVKHMWGIYPKVLKCTLVLAKFHDTLTYFKTLRLKAVMWGTKPKCWLVLTQFHDPLTYFKTFRAIKAIMWGIKTNGHECRSMLTVDPVSSGRVTKHLLYEYLIIFDLCGIRTHACGNTASTYGSHTHSPWVLMQGTYGSHIKSCLPNHSFWMREWHSGMSWQPRRSF